jgi:Dolichyl-phosphate-mannose-protein mannosyltransferase
LARPRLFPPLLFGLAILTIGLAYRATFLNQGFNGSDETWLEALALRTLHGQVPYRDFYYAVPPLSLYKETAIAGILGAAYGVLASRWVFAVEVSVGSVLAFIVLRRYVGGRTAMLATLPTVFFTTILYYYSNFNFDGQVLALAAIAIAVHRGDRRTWMIASGAMLGLAFLAKPTYLAILALIIATGLLRRFFAGPQRWLELAAGFAVTVGSVFGILWVAGLWAAFRYQSFGLLVNVRRLPLRWYVYEDWPTYLTVPGQYGGWLLLAAVTLLILGRTFMRTPAAVVLGAVLVAMIPAALETSRLGTPTYAQLELLASALGLLLVINAAAAVLTLAARMPRIERFAWAEVVRHHFMPPVLPVLAFSMEYLHTISVTSMRFAYVGTFLAIPVALVFLAQLASLKPVAASSRLSAPVLGVWIAAAGAVITLGSPYLDGPRADMTAVFAAPRLAGVRTVPAEAGHVDRVAMIIEERTKQGDSVLIFPDGQAYYLMTGRVNPTKVDWYDLLATTPAMGEEAALDMARNPPKLVVLERYRESDIQHLHPLEFDSEPAWKPVYDYVLAHYTRVDSTPDADVYVLTGLQS